MLLGGAVNGGRVIADWPGLADAALYEGRDLKPTLGLDTLIHSAMVQHFDLPPAAAAARLFPEMRSARAVHDLLRG